MRLDVYLLQSGLCKSRTEAARLIAEGAVLFDGVPIKKAAFAVAEGTSLDRFSVSVEAHPFVGRGGEKLQAALEHFRLSPAGRTALDVGASTGGFTDCLLRNGAAHVYAVDSGSGQLADSLRRDPRVTVREHCNARDLTPADFPNLPTFAVMDVSFISQTLILPALAAILPDEATLITLIKPQFEVGRGKLGKGGIVKEPRYRREAIERVCLAADSLGFAYCEHIDSPILGGDGNHEYLAAFIRRKR